MAAKKKAPTKKRGPRNKGGRVRTDKEIMDDQEIMIGMMREGLRPPDILARINEIRPYKIGIVTVYKDIQNACRKAWDRICDNVNALRAQQIQEHLHAADEALEAWKQSKEPIKKTEMARRGKGKAAVESSKVSEEERPGDPRFLAVWIQIQARLSFLYGIKEEIEVNVNEGGELDMGRAESYFKRLTAIRQRTRTNRNN